MAKALKVASTYSSVVERLVWNPGHRRGQNAMDQAIIGLDDRQMFSQIWMCFALWLGWH